MATNGQTVQEDRATAAPSLADLIPIAVVIAAGCEDCAERMVGRALQQGCRRSAIEQTLGIVTYLSSRECFSKAVGPEAVARMAGPLRAAKRAARAVAAAVENPLCHR